MTLRSILTLDNYEQWSRWAEENNLPEQGLEEVIIDRGRRTLQARYAGRRTLRTLPLRTDPPGVQR